MAMRKQRRLVEISEGKSVAEQMALRVAVADDLGTDLQTLMFIPSLRATFSEEQQAQWLPRALSWEVVGCYAQTELGHGSNVRGIETTATYVPETDEIEIHSPTLTATKWWPGALGRTANHAIVFARLLVAGRDLGIHNFLVQIRDLETHAPLPGVAVGDIGSKIGYNAQDNGFCRFERRSRAVWRCFVRWRFIEQLKRSDGIALQQKRFGLPDHRAPCRCRHC